MANIPAKHTAAYDTSSVDDGRHISPVAMILGAIIAIASIMAIVYSPKLWGIDRFGSDVVGTGATGHSSTDQGSPTAEPPGH